MESFLWLLCAECAVGAGVRTKPAGSWQEDQARRLEGKRLWMLRPNRLEREDGSEITELKGIRSCVVLMVERGVWRKVKNDFQNSPSAIGLQWVGEGQTRKGVSGVLHTPRLR